MKQSQKIGVTERGDPAFDHGWIDWVRNGNPAIIITKNCCAIEKILDGLMAPNVIVHCTITGWGGTAIEPNVPPAAITLESYKSLSNKYGKDRVVLRIDPVIPTLAGIDRAEFVNSHKIGRVRISFLDAYDHVRRAFKNNNINIHEGFHAQENIRKETWELLGRPDTCAEPGLPSTGCISNKDCEILGVDPLPIFKGQRPLCSCLANKIELLNSDKKRCPHGCLYCYWKGY